ncbi:Trigger factor [Desulfamplus magnetovallimortis]|uniref:Trigger factor n=1 Tax=Desulfamplus magnetovallimortis TaxID=1246637 RepID=A0A1W1HCS4_9BACT|nr:trigger factor [Desulfamplus magnetovallimortis]SLM30259.1 Trigger factor [Desulfamplus magnetovallimortis]
MQVNIEDVNTVKKHIHFEIPCEDVKIELDKAYKELNKTASIKGFRKGKIPRKVLESRFGKDVNADISARMVQNAFVEVAENNDYEIIGKPVFNPETPVIEQGKDLIFDLDFEIRPQLDDIDFKGLELNKNLYRVTNEEIDVQLKMIQRQMSTKEVVTEERPVKSSDFVMIDYEGFVDGEPFSATPKVENYVMSIGSKALPEAFSEKLTGSMSGQELEIEVVYPEDDKNKEIAGKTVLFKVLLKEIQEQVLPPIDDELAKKLGQYETLEDVKKVIAKNLQMGIETRVHQEMSEQIFQQLLDRCQFDTPDALVDAELNAIVAETEQNLAHNNLTMEELGFTVESIKERSREVAEKQARRHILLGKIIKQENLELNEEEIEKLCISMAYAMGATTEVVKALLQESPQQAEYIKYTELEKKAVNLIIDNSTIIEVTPEIEGQSASIDDASEKEEAISSDPTE